MDDRKKKFCPQSYGASGGGVSCTSRKRLKGSYHWASLSRSSFIADPRVKHCFGCVYVSSMMKTGQLSFSMPETLRDRFRNGPTGPGMSGKKGTKLVSWQPTIGSFLPSFLPGTGTGKKDWPARTSSIFDSGMAPSRPLLVPR